MFGAPNFYGVIAKTQIETSLDLCSSSFIKKCQPAVGNFAWTCQLVQFFESEFQISNLLFLFCAFSPFSPQNEAQKRKNMKNAEKHILTSEPSANHPFADQNTEQCTYNFWEVSWINLQWFKYSLQQ